MRDVIRCAARDAVVGAARPLWRRIWARIEARLLPIETHLRSLDARVVDSEAVWRQHVPAFLNAVSSVGAFGLELSRTRAELGELRTRSDATRTELEELRTHSDATRTELEELRTRSDATRTELEELRAKFGGDIGRMWERLEFMRREILFEMKYARRHDGTSGDGSPAVSPRIVAAEKVAAAQASDAGFRLNLGCGHVPFDDYVNVDQRDLPGVDVVADVQDLPFEPGTAREIFSAHLLEHFPQEALRRSMLPYWRSLLEPGGNFRAVVPDGEAMVAGMADGSYPFEDFREVLFGAQEYEGDFHFNLFTPKSLAALLEEAGFRGVAVPVRARRNGKCFEFEIHAER
jgi:hypothetical protein